MQDGVIGINWAVPEEAWVDKKGNEEIQVLKDFDENFGTIDESSGRLTIYAQIRPLLEWFIENFDHLGINGSSSWEEMCKIRKSLESEFNRNSDFWLWMKGRLTYGVDPRNEDKESIQN